MFVCCECCVLSGRGLCDEMITRPEESYRLWCVVLFDLKTSRMRRPWPALGRSATKKNPLYFSKFLNLGVELHKDCVNDAETCSSDTELYLYISSKGAFGAESSLGRLTGPQLVKKIPQHFM